MASESEAVHLQQPVAGDGGIKTPSISQRDPYEILDELMVVVEALCPRWPPRGTFRADGLWLL